MCKGGSNQVSQSGSQSQTYVPNDRIRASGNTALGMAGTAAGAPFSMPVAPVAPFTPLQSTGFNALQGIGGMAQPYINAGANYLAQSADPAVTQGLVGSFYNPMAANVTAQMKNIFGQQDVQNTGNLVGSAGGVGADRVAVGQANLANQQDLAAGQTYANLYNQAVNYAMQQQQMTAGAGFGTAQLGPAAQAAATQAAFAQLQGGGQQQQLTQAQLNAIYQNQLAGIAYPFQTAQYLSGITAGLAPAMGGSTYGNFQNQTTYPQPSPFAQILGGATAGAGLLGGLGSIPFGTGTFGGAFSNAAQYLPGGSAFGATPMYVNGGYYPMFGYRGGKVEGKRLAPGGPAMPQQAVPQMPMGGQQMYPGMMPAVMPRPFSVGPTNFPYSGMQTGSMPSTPFSPYDDGGAVIPGKEAGATPIPTMPFSGQGGKSGPYGQWMMFHPAPTKQSGGSGSSGGLGQLGRFGGSLGNMLGGLGGTGAAGAPLDLLGGTGAADALGVGDIAAGAGDAAALFALVNRGGRIPRMDAGGGMGGDPNRGWMGPVARRWQGFESRFPKEYYDPHNGVPIEPGILLDSFPSIDLKNPLGPDKQNFGIGRTAAGGAVNPMSAYEGFDDGGDVTSDPRADEGVVPQAWDYIANTAAPATMDFLRSVTAGRDRVPPVKDESRMPMEDDGGIPLPRPRPTVVGFGEGPVSPSRPSDFLPFRPGTGEATASPPPPQTPVPTKGQDRVPMLPATAPTPSTGPRPYPLHPMDPRDPNYDPSLDPHNPMYNPNDPRLVFVDPTTRGDPRAPGVGGGGYRAGMPTDPMGATSTPGPGFQPGTPYPDALQRDWGQNLTRSPWMALVKAGAAMMSQPGNVGTVIGAGLKAGTGELEGQRQQLRSEELVNQKAAQLVQLAQQHLETIAERREYHGEMENIAKRNADIRETHYTNADIVKVQAAHPEIPWSTLTPDQVDAAIRRFLPNAGVAPRVPAEPVGSSRETAIPDPGPGARSPGTWYMVNGQPKQWIE